jgi:hypothetical protein
VNPNGIEIRTGLTAGVPRSSYSVLVVDSSCQVLVRGGTLTTDDSGRGDLDFHVLGSTVPPGTTVRVEVVDPATATVPGPGPFVDVLTSDAVSAP